MAELEAGQLFGCFGAWCGRVKNVLKWFLLETSPKPFLALPLHT